MCVCVCVCMVSILIVCIYCIVIIVIGIGGKWGIPAWAFFVNRGKCGVVVFVCML